MKDDILIGDTPKAQKRRRRVKKMSAAGRLWKHSKLSDIDGLLGDQDTRDFFVFTLVRNPWDRMVSYYHWLKEQKFDHAAVDVAKTNGFSSFLSHPHMLRSIGGENYGHYMCDHEGRERCDLFIRIEHLNADIAPLENHLGFRLGPIERVNRSDRAQDYRAYYTASDCELVGKLFETDIDRFGYDFDGDAPR